MFITVSWLYMCILSQWAHDHARWYLLPPTRTAQPCKNTCRTSPIPKGPSWLQCHHPIRKTTFSKLNKIVRQSSISLLQRGCKSMFAIQNRWTCMAPAFPLMCSFSPRLLFFWWYAKLSITNGSRTPGVSCAQDRDFTTAKLPHPNALQKWSEGWSNGFNELNWAKNKLM